MHGIDRQFLAERSGDEDERNIGPELSGECKGGDSVESWQRIIRQNQIDPPILQGGDKGLAPIDPVGLTRNAPLVERCQDQLGVNRIVFQVEES